MSKPETMSNAITPFESIRNRLLRLNADSPDLLGIIKQEGKA